MKTITHSMTFWRFAFGGWAEIKPGRSEFRMITLYNYINGR